MKTATDQLFLERALHEAKRYGGDTWVFLREWVQNSRDAGAGEVALRAAVDMDSEWVECMDDGVGMSDAEMRQYLFRLYASSKEQDAQSIGFFGVGFWSILLFEPSWILIESCKGDQATAYRLDCETFEIESVEPSLSSHGFRVKLHRRRRFARSRDLIDELSVALIRFAGPIRPLPPQLSLRLTVNGFPVNQPLKQPQFLATSLVLEGARGYVGFGTRPWVRLYKGGILLRELTDLHELLPRRGRKYAPKAPGVYAQVAVDDDNLTVLMDRKSVFEDDHLVSVCEACEGTLVQLEKQLIRSLFPLNWTNRRLRIWDHLPKKILVVSIALMVMLMLIVALWPAKAPYPPRPELHSSSLDTVFDHWQQSTIDQAGRPSSWQYQSSAPTGRLVVGHLTDFDPMFGLQPPAKRAIAPYPQLPGAAEPLRLTLGVSGQNAPTLLPVPSGMGVVAGSVTFEGRPVHELGVTAEGMPLVDLEPVKAGTLTYEITQATVEPIVDSRYLETTEFPPQIAAQLDELSRLTPAERVEGVKRLTYLHLEFAQDEQSAQQFISSDLEWVSKTLQIGKGDCDVMNGLAVLMLRAVDIPAFVTVGLPEDDGDMGALHAWTQFHDGTWQMVDFSHGRSQSTNGPSPTPALGQQSAPLTWAWQIPVGILIIGGAVWLWRKRSRRNSELPDQAGELLAQIIEDESSKESELGKLAHYVPALRTIHGGKLSLREIEKLALRHTPILADAKDPRLSVLHPSTTILDRTCPFVAKLMPILPSMLTLDQLERFQGAGPIPDVLKPVGDAIQRHDKSSKLVVLDHIRSSTEARIRFLDGWQQYLAIPARAEWLLRAIDHHAHEPLKATISAAVELLSRQVTYRGAMDAIMADVVKEQLA